MKAKPIKKKPANKKKKIPESTDSDTEESSSEDSESESSEEKVAAHVLSSKAGRVKFLDLTEWTAEAAKKTRGAFTSYAHGNART